MYSYRAENKPDTSESIGTEKGEKNMSVESEVAGTAVNSHHEDIY